MPHSERPGVQSRMSDSAVGFMFGTEYAQSLLWWDHRSITAQGGGSADSRDTEGLSPALPLT